MPRLKCSPYRANGIGMYRIWAWSQFVDAYAHLEKAIEEARIYHLCPVCTSSIAHLLKAEERISVPSMYVQWLSAQAKRALQQYWRVVATYHLCLSNPERRKFLRMCRARVQVAISECLSALQHNQDWRVRRRFTDLGAQCCERSCCTAKNASYPRRASKCRDSGQIHATQRCAAHTLQQAGV